MDFIPDTPEDIQIILEKRQQQARQALIEKVNNYIQIIFYSFKLLIYSFSAKRNIGEKTQPKGIKLVHE